MFDIEIAGQMSAWFIKKENRRGREMPHLKLIKLLYLAERTSIQTSGELILGDRMISMDNGPVLSRTLNFMQGYRKPNNGWDKWVSPKENHRVSLARDFGLEDLDLLNVATIRTLEGVWNKHAHRDQWDMVDYTHRYCREWKDPKGSSEPISYETLLLKGFKYSKRKAEKEAKALEDQRKLVCALYEAGLE